MTKKWSFVGRGGFVKETCKFGTLKAPKQCHNCVVVYADDVFTAPWNWHVFANGLETVRVKWHFFTLLRKGLLRYIVYTCPQLNVTRVQSATEGTASVHTLHMSAT